jgi:hypothetical protein
MGRTSAVMAQDRRALAVARRLPDGLGESGPPAMTYLDDRFISINEAAARLDVSHQTIRRRMRDGTWPRGVFWFQPEGSNPRLSWKALLGWIQTESATSPC